MIFQVAPTIGQVGGVASATDTEWFSTNGTDRDDSLTFFNSKVNGPMGRYGFDIIATSISGHRATLSTPLLQTNTQAFLETLVRHW